MTISAQIIADSISPAGIRLTTFQLRYPRFIHAELMTHRVFSRNASSSRAIPVKKLIADIKDDPAMPVYWGGHQAGMQAAAELTGADLDAAKSFWLMGMRNAIHFAEQMVGVGLHKQIANRILEPWAHINVIVTATDWMNFYVLRRDSHAQPEIKALADMMWDLQVARKPRILQPGQWHLPYIDEHDFDDAHTSSDDKTVMGDPEVIARLTKVSVARCARVSYLTFKGKVSSFDEDLALYDRLLGSQPLHASPAEHQATPDAFEITDEVMSRAAGKGGKYAWPPAFQHPDEHGNFRGWRQYRKMLPAEFIEDVDSPIQG